MECSLEEENVSFIALISKKENPMDLGEFRPISLVGCIYKVVAKLLSKRMNDVNLTRSGSLDTGHRVLG
ncbi:hypothetical protein HKD37_07G018843 [Glycine soja]